MDLSNILSEEYTSSDCTIPYEVTPADVTFEAPKVVNEADNETEDKGNISDGYHTFNELYHHRTVLFSVICNQNPSIAWKSKQHSDPNDEMYEGMFIVGIDTPFGQATYHCDDKYWDLFKVTELERAKKFDGHTPDEAISRIEKFSRYGSAK